MGHGRTGAGHRHTAIALVALVVVFALAGLRAPPARTAASRPAAPVCSDATAWSIAIGSIAYYFVRTGGGWVASYAIDGSNPFATASLSVSQHSFGASDVYNGANTGYTARFSATLGADCAVTSSKPGHWTSNHDPVGGTFTATAIGLAGKRRKRPCPVHAGRQAHTAAVSCPLKVFVKIVGPIANYGTRSGLSVDNLLPNEGPVNFTVGTFSQTQNPLTEPFSGGQKCVSGCANLLITVIDPTTNKPPSGGAKVTADLGTIDTQDAPDLSQQGHQFICTQVDAPASPECGSTLSSLKTDQYGQVHLLYWAPGELVTAHTNLIVRATATCSTTCSSGERSGEAQQTIGVRPYQIYSAHGALSPEAMSQLLTFTGNAGFYDLKVAAVHRYLELYLEWLAQQEVIAERAVEVTVGPIGYAIAEVAIPLAQAWSEHSEEVAVIAGLLKSLNLNPAGLFAEPFAKSVPAVDDHFQQLLLTGAGNSFHIGAGGLLWTLGERVNERLRQLKQHTPVAERVRLTVYEASSCDLRDPVCGTGYGAATSGITPALCMHFAWSGAATYDDVACFRYNAVAWVSAQHISQALAGASTRKNVLIPGRPSVRFSP